jgi:GDP-D-mannose 3',5'-epimerase
MDPMAPVTREDTAYPAKPDSEYLAYKRNHVARYHNIFGPEGTWTGGRGKSPAALCRKVAEATPGGAIEIWGDGLQTRSLLYIADCIEATLRLTKSEIFAGPVNIGSEEMVTINHLAKPVMKIADKKLGIEHVPGPLGVRGRKLPQRASLIREKLGWEPKVTLERGIAQTYPWILGQPEVARGRNS